MNGKQIKSKRRKRLKIGQSNLQTVELLNRFLYQLKDDKYLIPDILIKLSVSVLQLQANTRKIMMKLKSMLIRAENFLKIKKFRLSNPYNIPIYLVVGGFMLFTVSVGKTVFNNFQIMSTNTARQVRNIKIPKFMRQYIYTFYVNKYGVNLEQAELELSQYQNFSEFFTRKIKKRPHLDEEINNEKTICCPCDSQILNISKIVSNNNIIVKDVEYSLNTFLFQLQAESQKDKLIKDLSLNNDSDLYQVIFYLSPSDYHRFHSPTTMDVKVCREMPGALKPVNIQSLLLNGGIVYEQNGRKILHCQYENKLNLKRYYLGYVMVGAMNVSDIVLNAKRTYRKGDQIGYFNLGSTIVMIMQIPKSVKWNKKIGDKVKYGERLCQFQ